ncbi:DNA polymerase III subunit gamma/tau [Flagellatimonas centrodinii]|uniref:DNA polymerase III subunit gamma/tau n=1 Tax=Flagellatimonas centrodinii TaxID=2806210 RepID=UPI001FED7361|nr:DNA polymerase III subunit gamma/tau [Flagellatimonas centrodinii]ULQ45789.1 DNA polymerase III subunit gamma/tau [Flagellatimonas centrodinii]
MSYLALARKWRPRRFEDVLGQAPVVQALTHALNQDRLHPAILLTGTRGVGKTTLARIISKGLNCETGVSAQPCGICSSCKEIDEGRSVDMLEIDAASNTGVDNIREIIENSQYAPARSRYKVYLIDEVHMLSKGAFNALLKTLEEPPPHVKFILATTDPQKLPVTVLSRCLQFGLRRMPVALIRQQLSQIAEAEGVEAEAAALGAIARAADGSMRDGLSLLDQAIAFAGGAAVQGDAVDALLGTATRAVLWPLLQALVSDDRDTLAAQFGHLEALAPDYAALLDEMALVLQRMAVVQLLPQARSDDDEAELLALAETTDPETLQLYYQIVVLGRRDLTWSPDPRIGFEMTVLRMLAFRPDAGEGLPAGNAGGRRAAPAAAARPAGSAPSAASDRPAATRPSPAVPPPPPTDAVDDAVGSPTRASSGRVASMVSGQPWEVQVERLGLEAFTKGLARNCCVLSEADGVLHLSLDPGAAHLLSDDRCRALGEALSAARGSPVTVQVTPAPAPLADTPAKREAQRLTEQQQQVEARLQADPTLQALQQQFGATVKRGSMRPAS